MTTAQPLDRRCPTCRQWLQPAALRRHAAMHAAAPARRALADQHRPTPRLPSYGRMEECHMSTLTDAQRAALAAARAKENQVEAERRAQAAARFAAYQAQTPAERALAQHQLPKPQEAAHDPC